MPVLLDECLPRGLARALVGHQVGTVQSRGWAGPQNGALLRLIAGEFDVFVTVDANLPALNAVSRLSFAVLVIRSKSNRLADLLPLSADLLLALAAIRPGETRQIGF